MKMLYPKDALGTSKMQSILEEQADFEAHKPTSKPSSEVKLKQANSSLPLTLYVAINTARTHGVAL